MTRLVFIFTVVWVTSATASKDPAEIHWEDWKTNNDQGTLPHWQLLSVG